MLEETACHVGHLDLLTDAITKPGSVTTRKRSRHRDSPTRPLVQRRVRLWFYEAGKPHQRAYTLVDPDVEAGTFSMEFALHDGGCASDWSLTAEAGDTIDATLQGTGFEVLDPLPPRMLVIGDPASAFVWVACDTKTTRMLMSYLLKELSVPRNRVKSLGYWRAA